MKEKRPARDDARSRAKERRFDECASDITQGATALNDNDLLTLPDEIPNARLCESAPDPSLSQKTGSIVSIRTVHRRFFAWA